jgi:hypothetical protein
MDIKISTKEKNDTPTTFIFHGNYALETMLEKILEKYYGSETKNTVMKILNTKITEEDINNILNKKVSEKEINELLKKQVTEQQINEFLQRKVL